MLAAPDAIVIANIEGPTPSGIWLLTVDVVQRDGSIISGAVDFGVPDGWTARTQLGRVRLTSDGWAAIAINTIDEFVADNNGVAVINVLANGQASGAIPGVGPRWLPDGVLLMSYDGERVVRRIADHGFGDVSDLADDDGAPTAIWRGFGYVVEGDLSGVVGWERDFGEPPYVSMLWDGSVIARQPHDPVYLEMGNERLAGAGGDITEAREVCHFQDLCPIRLRRPNGNVLAIPGLPVDTSWTRDGTALVMLDFEGPW